MLRQAQYDRMIPRKHTNNRKHRTMKFLQRMICLLLVPVLTTGCIKDDMGDCDNVSLSFRYLADGDTDVLRQYMDKIDLYVFNAQNQLVDILTYSQDDLSDEEQAVRLRLSPGTYRVVALGNAYDRTAVEGVGAANFDQIFIQHPDRGTSVAIDGYDPIYLGQKEITVPGGNKSLHETVSLYSSHVNTTVEIHGLSAPDAGDDVPYRIRFVNANAQTTFNNTVTPGQTETCEPALYYDSSTGTYRTNGLALFRMDNNGQLDADLCRHRLQLLDATGNVVAECNLYNYLQANSGTIDITRQEADLPISITITPLGITIEVPSWYVEDINPDWTR